jgi:hypothetical protein
MTVRTFFVATLFLTACGQIKSTPEIKAVDTMRNSVKDTVATNTPELLPDSTLNSKKTDTAFDCVKGLHALVYSALTTPLKDAGFAVWVDTVNADSAILEIVHRNEERGDHVPFNWLKIDFNKNQIIDLSADADKPVELTYDTILYQKIIKNCR